MNEELIDREALIKRINNYIYKDYDEVLWRLLEDCRAALSRSSLDKPTRYVPMTDDERNQMMARWYENHDLPSISQYIESEFDRIFRKQKEPADEALPTEAIPSDQSQPEVGNGDGGTP